MARRSIERRSQREDNNPEPEDEEPQGRRSRRNEESEEPRGRGRSRRSSEEEEEAPRGRTRRSSRDEEEDDAPPRGRRSSRDDDGEERPKRERGKSTTVGKGWGGYEKVKTASSDYVNAWKLPNKATLVKFLDDEPFSTYSEHWLDERKGKKSFVCLGEDCPLCDIGDRPSGYALFNVLVFEDLDNPKVEIWKTGKKVGNVLHEYSKDKKTSPLNRDDLYWSVFTSGEKAGNRQTNIQTVKERDLLDDWDVDPLTDDELDEYEKDKYVEEDFVYINSRKELREIANSYDD